MRKVGFAQHPTLVTDRPRGDDDACPQVALGEAGEAKLGNCLTPVAAISVGNSKCFEVFLAFIRPNSGPVLVRFRANFGMATIRRTGHAGHSGDERPTVGHERRIERRSRGIPCKLGWPRNRKGVPECPPTHTKRPSSRNSQTSREHAAQGVPRSKKTVSQRHYKRQKGRQRSSCGVAFERFHQATNARFDRNLVQLQRHDLLGSFSSRLIVSSKNSSACLLTS